MACNEQFKDHIIAQELEFYPLEISKNANVGIATTTTQPKEERKRLQEFFNATYQGPISTLSTQSRHRQRDMLVDPIRIRQEIATMVQHTQPDLLLVDQLSYSVTLALYCLQLPFITYCPGHPSYVVKEDMTFGKPQHWPTTFDMSSDQLRQLDTITKQTEDIFTSIFNDIIQDFDPSLAQVSNAFHVTSSLAILYNYPEFKSIASYTMTKKIFMGYCFSEQRLPQTWKEQLRLHSRTGVEQIIYLSFGTFLSARNDVLKSLIEIIVQHFPQWLLIVSAGSSYADLETCSSTNVIIKEFVPQKALLPHVDIVIFHGGNNTFTESLYYGKPMIILPFSSDQFSIAYDAELNKIAAVLDPNSFTKQELLDAIQFCLDDQTKQQVAIYQAKVQQRGPKYAITKLLSLL